MSCWKNTFFAKNKKTQEAIAELQKRIALYKEPCETISDLSTGQDLPADETNKNQRSKKEAVKENGNN